LGKSRTTKKKRIVDLLLQKYPNNFTTNFEENKKNVTDLMTISSQQLRNNIAGYLTRVMNNTQKQQRTYENKNS